MRMRGCSYDDLLSRSNPENNNVPKNAFTAAAIAICSVNHASGSASSKLRIKTRIPSWATKKLKINANRAAGCSVSSRAPIEDAKYPITVLAIP